MLRIAFAVCLLALSAACAQLPRAELQAYRDSFQAAQSASAPIMESYAARERAETIARLRRDRNIAADTDFFDEFKLADAAAVSTLNLPPGAEAADRSFRAIARYNDTLVALAENRNIDEAKAQLHSLRSELVGIAPVLEGAFTELVPIVNLLKPFAEAAIAEDNREQFRLIVINGHDEVVQLIDVLRDLAPHQFTIITAQLRQRANAAPVAERAPIAKQINDWHTVFANYVALLDAMKDKLGRLRDAVENPRSVPLLVRANEGAADIRAHADALRRAIAELQAPM